VATYKISNDVVYFPDTNETYVPVHVTEEGSNDATIELWTIDKVQNLEDSLLPEHFIQ